MAVKAFFWWEIKLNYWPEMSRHDQTALISCSRKKLRFEFWTYEYVHLLWCVHYNFVCADHWPEWKQDRAISDIWMSRHDQTALTSGSGKSFLKKRFANSAIWYFPTDLNVLSISLWSSQGEGNWYYTIS